MASSSDDDHGRVGQDEEELRVVHDEPPTLLSASGTAVPVQSADPLTITAPGGRRGSVPSPGRIRVIPAAALTILTFAVVAAVTVTFLQFVPVPGLPWYGLAVGMLLIVKLGLSLVPEPHRAPPRAGMAVAVVVPMYNEDPSILARTLASIEAQDYAPTFVVVVDDGSKDVTALRIAQQWAAIRPYAQVIANAVNQGKREALASAFHALAGRVEVWVCVDSDTVLDPAAVGEGLAEFSDQRVAAVTGTVVALNPHRGWLARMIDLRYVNAFLYERGAYSTLGSVLCVCGSLAFWRADIVAEHLDDFVGQTFLGQRATYGDDRHMTNLSLLHGRVVLSRRAVARTAVPERFGHFVRQQTRWSKSFFRESMWSLSRLSPRRWAWWLTLVEVGSWAVFTAALITVLVILPIMTHQEHFGRYFIWASLAGYARSVHIWSVRRPDWPRRQQWLTFLLSPTYAVLHIVAVIPLRVYALVTLRNTGWGTRTKGAEVRLP